MTSWIKAQPGSAVRQMNEDFFARAKAITCQCVPTQRLARRAMTNPGWSDPVPRDQTGMVAWPAPGGALSLLAGSSSYEDGQIAFGSVRAFDLHRKNSAPEDFLPGFPSSTGPLALADIDGDGDLDLFVGGRVVPGRYPEPASSRLFRNHEGVFRLDTETTSQLEKAGLVNGAVFSDLDNDGAPELILACEWGPVRIFQNRAGQFRDATKTFGMDEFRGWWNGVNTGDFNGDGRMDIVASNWGRNSRYEHFRQQPLRLYYGDFNGDGGIQTLEAYAEPRSRKFVPWRRLDDVARAMPFVNATFETFAAFGQASIDEVLGDRISKATVLDATWLESTLFLNRGDRFEPVPLPAEAQMAPAFAVCVADLDGDGFEDIFLSQNFFAVQTEMSRYDAGRGLWLRGDGRGQFQAVTGADSGLLIYGEQRGAALCDYDHDGRVDLVVSQNGAATKLFNNQTAAPGLRVRLAGPAGNPQGIGAVLQLGFASGTGPAREIHSGAGYLSQDSATQVLASSVPAQNLQIRWPGGTTTTNQLPPAAREILVGADGKVTKIR